MTKLDGHTRALMWKRGQIPSPVILEVNVIEVKDKAQIEELYKTFDSREALETMRDKVSGAFKRYGFEPESGLLVGGSLTSALRMAYSVLSRLRVSSAQGGAKGPSDGIGGPTKSQKPMRTDVYQMINEFSYELAALDGFGLGSGQASAGIVAAFMLSYRKYGHKITPFWTGVFGNAGSKIDGQMDAIQALNELVLTRRGRYGGTAAIDLCSRALMAVEKWLKDEMLHTIPRPLDTADYLVGHEKPAERLIKKADLTKK